MIEILPSRSPWSCTFPKSSWIPPLYYIPDGSVTFKIVFHPSFLNTSLSWRLHHYTLQGFLLPHQSLFWSWASHSSCDHVQLWMASGNYLESPFLFVLYFVSPKRKCCSLFPQYSSLFFSISLSDIPSYNLFFQCPHSFYPIYHPIISNLPPNYISTCSFRLSSILVKASSAFPTCTTASLALISLLPFLSHYWPLSIATKMIRF